MWAVVGMFSNASVSAFWAMPPIRFANQRAACAAAGMKGGFGRSWSSSDSSRPRRSTFRIGLSFIARRASA